MTSGDQVLMRRGISKARANVARPSNVDVLGLLEADHVLDGLVLEVPPCENIQDMKNEDGQ